VVTYKVSKRRTTQTIKANKNKRKYYKSKPEVLAG
jgi:hypothetical protein